MAVRPGMQLIVAQIRRNGQASQTDEFNGETFWSDEQLQEIADVQSERLLIKLLPINSATKTEYSLKCPRHYWFETDSIAVMSLVSDDTLPIITTSFTYNPVRGEIIFAEDLSDCLQYVVQGYAVNMWMASADLWEQKAAQRYDYSDFKAGNNKINLSQEHQHCLNMSKMYRNRIIRRYDRSGTGRWASGYK
jgi:hypothetical protein